MNELLETIETMSETDIELLVEKLKERVLIPFYMMKEDVKRILDYIDRDNKEESSMIQSLMTRYSKRTDDKILDDIFKFLIEHTEEWDIDQNWSNYVSNLIYGLRDFDLYNRDDKIKKIMRL